MPQVKRLLIAALGREGNDQILPVNTGNFVDIDSEIGRFSISVFIKDFDGSKQHRANSLFNVGDEEYLNGEKYSKSTSSNPSDVPNLRILINFTPSANINGNELLFGNDCPTPVRDYIPTTLLSTGIKFFSWFINPTITHDIYCDEPYLYGLALNSFTKIGTGTSTVDQFVLASDESLDEDIDIPKKPQDRRKFFCKTANASKFTFRQSAEYRLMFDTNFVNIGNSDYNVAIPTYGDRTFNINVLRYANEQLDNFNWTVKRGQLEKEGANSGKFGLNLNFKLLNESNDE